MLKRYLGDRVFYRRMLAVSLPMIIQNGITNFVALLDNIMVGQVGTVQMSGVAIVNQLMFVFNMCVFGAVSGAGIFTAQFYGLGDHKGSRDTFRFKFLVSLALAIAGIALFLTGGSTLIRFYLQGDGKVQDAAASLAYGLDYLHVMLLGLVPFALSNAYASTLRETDQGIIPMLAGICAVCVNLSLNYVLIFGHGGFPAMGVRGAAIATVISRYTELCVVALWTHLNPDRNRFIQGAFRSWRIPSQLARSITLKGMPLMVNEALWASGMAIMNQCYSTRGLDVVAATNISTTLYNLASVVYLSTGMAVGIIIGQMLGAGKSAEEVRTADRKLVVASVGACMLFSFLMFAVSGVFPRIYNTTDAVRSLAAKLICISALMMPFNAYTNAAYFTLRSGGKTLVTFLFDSCFVWCCCVPLAYCLSRFTAVPIVPLFFICQGLDLFKCLLGGYMIRRGDWIQNLVDPT